MTTTWEPDERARLVEMLVDSPELRHQWHDDPYFKAAIVTLIDMLPAFVVGLAAQAHFAREGREAMIRERLIGGDPPTIVLTPEQAKKLGFK